MIQLPILRKGVHGDLILDDTASVRARLCALADLYREDPEGVGDVLIRIADLGDQAEGNRCAGGCDCAARVRDGALGDLLVDMGGARTLLDPNVTHRALMQARRLAVAAQSIADAARARVDELASLTALARHVREEAWRPAAP
ncbi:hypothetical protein [Streptomyces sp. NPDC056463]|uniref:hypothetical protein n=1 Tax=Streptomyces sp. NPDC056463 TaxID=3345827 RepID=UPI0036A0BED9